MNHSLCVENNSFIFTIDVLGMGSCFLISDFLEGFFVLDSMNFCLKRSVCFCWSEHTILAVFSKWTPFVWLWFLYIAIRRLSLSTPTWLDCWKSAMAFSSTPFGARPEDKSPSLLSFSSPMLHFTDFLTIPIIIMIGLYFSIQMIIWENKCDMTEHLEINVELRMSQFTNDNAALAVSRPYYIGHLKWPTSELSMDFGRFRFLINGSLRDKTSRK